MTGRTALRLGRVSNLPTVWTNGLAGVVLAGGDPGPALLAWLLFALSCFYVGGMYLNDAFDREIDARERPERPIPAGEARAATVFVAGFGLLGTGLAAVAVTGFVLEARAGAWPLGMGALLAAAIVAYDAYHKGNPAAPFQMALCRALVYGVAASAVAGAPSPDVLGGASALFAYVVGLTYVARFEAEERVARGWPLALLAWPFAYGAWAGAAVPGAWALLVLFALATFLALRRVRSGAPGAIPAGVGALIAGISLLDAVLIAGRGETGLALVAAAGFPLTRLLQRRVPGT